MEIKKSRAAGKKKWPIVTLVIILVVALIGCGILFCKMWQDGDKTPIKGGGSDEAIGTAKPTVYYSKLTGSKVAKGQENTAVTAIMIENSPSARPQSGLKNSGVVFEAIAEGGITRFLVLYQSEKPQIIGPVRSLRTYYVEWLTPFDATVAHCGGSAAALQIVRGGGYKDMDEFFGGSNSVYWRASDRYAPHNVYTKFENIDRWNAAQGYTTSNFESFLRKDDSPAEEKNATNIAVNISSSYYNSRYIYDAASGTYLRSHEYDGAHMDREEGQISPKVVIAMMVDERRVMEDGYREQIDVVGSGKVFLFQDGTVQEGMWRKDGRGSQLKFMDQSGEELELNRGQTWITAVPNGSGGVSWQ